jgi:5-azacytidine-induced protein 1
MEQRIKRLREKFDSQLRDLERSEQTALAKYNECRQTLADATAELAILRGTAAQRDKELEEVRTLAARLTKERDNVTDVVRKEFDDKIAALEADVDSLRKQLTEERTTNRKELADVQAAKDDELEAIHQRVRAAIAMKDDTIKTLREQFETVALRADHLESVGVNLIVP